MGRRSKAIQLEVIVTLPVRGIVPANDVGIPALRELLQKFVEDLRYVNIENNQTGNLSGYDSDVVAFAVIPMQTGRLHVPDRIFRPSRQERILAGIRIFFSGGSDWGKSPAAIQVAFDLLHLIHDYASSLAGVSGIPMMKRFRSSGRKRRRPFSR